jgi:hypothetical protein
MVCYSLKTNSFSRIRLRPHSICDGKFLVLSSLKILE